ncbi:MAG: sulfatase [Spirosomataceae bacterium]
MLKRILLSTFLFSLLIVFGFRFRRSANAPKKPNILFLLVDDYGYRDLSVTGSSFYETPHMDQLFRQGMRFNQAYATYPRCVPSRYSIMTGSHPARQGQDDSGVVGFHIDGPTVSIGQAMKNSGYNTFYLGKWHLGGNEFAPSHQGFDQTFAAGAAGGVSSHFAPYNRDFQALGGVPEAETAPIDNVDNAPNGECLEDRLTDETVRMLKEFSAKKEPFFGILAHYAVHTPIEGKAEYMAYFKEKLKKNPPQGPEFEKESAGENKLTQDHPAYAAMIKSVDDGIGKIMKTLRELGIADNTIIVFTSDHGGLSARGTNKRELATSNRPLRAGKGHLYEGGLRVPMAVVWKGVVKAGTQTDVLVQGTDHFLTFLEMAGGKVPPQQVTDGKSYMKALKGGTADPNRPLFWHNPAPRPYATGDVYSSVIRVGNYKLLDLFGEEKRRELYDLKTDPGEAKNIAGDKPELSEKLYLQLESWRKSVGAYMNLTQRGLGKAPRQGNRNNN